MPTVESSAVERVDYSDGSRTLDIWYRGGGHYRYSGVPTPVYQALLASDSKGAFVNLHIKDHYPFEEVSRRRRLRPGD